VAITSSSCALIAQSTPLGRLACDGRNAPWSRGVLVRVSGCRWLQSTPRFDPYSVQDADALSQRCTVTGVSTPGRVAEFGAPPCGCSLELRPAAVCWRECSRARKTAHPAGLAGCGRSVATRAYAPRIPRRARTRTIPRAMSAWCTLPGARSNCARTFAQSRLSSASGFELPLEIAADAVVPPIIPNPVAATSRID
jgi:hypothetical protein